jgi:hypothetical protein
MSPLPYTVLGPYSEEVTSWALRAHCEEDKGPQTDRDREDISDPASCALWAEDERCAL